MNTEDNNKYAKFIETVCLERNSIVLGTLKEVFGDTANKASKRALKKYNSGISALEKSVLAGNYTRTVKQQTNRVCKDGNKVTEVIRVKEVGDMGDISESEIVDNLIQPVLFELFPSVFSVLSKNEFKLSELKHTNFVLDGLICGERNKLVLEYKKLGYYRKAKSLVTSSDIKNYIGELNSSDNIGFNPLVSTNNPQYLAGGLAKQAISYIEATKKICDNNNILVVSCGAVYCVCITADDKLTDLEVNKLRENLGLISIRSNANSGFFCYSNIPMFTFSMYDRDAELYLFYLQQLIKSYLNEDSNWKTFKKLYHEAFFNRLMQNGGQVK